MVTGPVKVTGVPRHVTSVKRISLTDHVIKVSHDARDAKVTKELEVAKVLDKWKASSWAKKRAARAAKANLSDFDRFKVMVARKKVSFFQKLFF